MNQQPATLTSLDPRGVFRVSLNRPQVCNAVDQAIIEGLEEALVQSREKNVRLVIIDGRGKGFCSGVDVTALLRMVGSRRHAEFRSLVERLQAIPGGFVQLEKPVIAVMHSFALGMGLEIALGADLRLATAGTRLALPETRLGLLADVGGTTRLTRLVGPARAKQMHLFGKEISAERALQWGLVDQVVPEDQLGQAVEDWVAKALAVAPLAAGLAKRVIERAVTDDPAACLAMEGICQSTLLETQDLSEGLSAWMQKRPPQFKGR